MIKVKIEKGYYLFKLEDILKEKNLSINKVMRDTNTDFKVLKRLLSGIWHFFSKEILLSIDNAYFFCKIFLFSLAYLPYLWYYIDERGKLWD